jgi:hypothetical protein
MPTENQSLAIPAHCLEQETATPLLQMDTFRKIDSMNKEVKQEPHNKAWGKLKEHVGCVW